MKKLDKNEKIKAGIIALMLIVVSFYGGMKYDQKSSASQQLSQGGRSGQGGQRFSRNGGGATSGSILSMDDKSITVQLRNGGSQIVFISGTTQVMKSVAGTIGDLSAGLNVTAIGKSNPDGSITAESVQIRPAGMNFPGMRGGQTQSGQ